MNGRLRREQIRLLYTNLVPSLVASVISAVLMVFVEYGAVPTPRLIFWFVVLVAIAGFRYGQVVAYRRLGGADGDQARWARWFMIGTVLAGVAWGSAALFLFPPDDLPRQIFIIFSLAGMTAGAVVSYSAMMSAAVAYNIGTILPLTTRLISEGTDLHLAMGVMALLFMFVMVITSRRMHETTLSSLTLRFENTDLVTHLASEKEATEKLNRDLQREIDERKRVEEGLREGEARTRAVVDNVLDGIITMDEHGIIESANVAAARTFGCVPQDLIGQHFKVLMPETEQAEYEDYLRAHMGRGEGRMIGFGLEIRGRRRDGTVFPMELGISQMWLDRRPHFIGIVRDITERRKAERLKSEFIATVSHELRTPLMSVMGSLELFAEGVAQDLPAHGRDLFRITRSNVERLADLIGDIVDMDDLQAGRFRLQLALFDFAPFAATSVQASQALAATRGVRIELNNNISEGRVYADRGRLAQVMRHLLANAVRSAPANSVVNVALDQVEGMLRVTVTDQGPGVAGSARGNIFEIFGSTEGADAAVHSGLGFSIARAVVELHGGRIGIDKSGAVSRVYFELPEWAEASSVAPVVNSTRKS